MLLLYTCSKLATSRKSWRGIGYHAHLDSYAFIERNISPLRIPVDANQLKIYKGGTHAAVLLSESSELEAKKDV